MDVPELLRIAWARGREFLDVLDRDRYSVTWPERVLTRPSVGERISVELAFLDTQRTFRHLAKIVEHVPGPPELVTFEFLAEDRAIRELIVCHAEGRSVPYLHRRAERALVWLPVDVRIADSWRRGFVTELSELGLFVTMARPPAPPSRVLLRMDAGRLEVWARVVYANGSGARVGFAGELVFATRGEEVRIRTAVRAALQAKKRS